MDADQLVKQAIEETSKLRSYGERRRDEEVVAATRRVLSLLGEFARSDTNHQDHRLVSIGEAIKLSGRSRNTIKGWVERQLLDGYRSPTNNELFVRRDQLLRLVDRYPVRSETPAPTTLPATADESRSEERVDRHRLAELRSLALHKRIAELIASNPSIVTDARRRVDHWLDGTERFSGSPAYAIRWRDLLAGPRRRLLAVLTSDSDNSRALRQSSPFAGVLSERERQAVYKDVTKSR